MQSELCLVRDLKATIFYDRKLKKAAKKKGVAERGKEKSRNNLAGCYTLSQARPTMETRLSI
jgi:hypothetical protein